MQKSVLINYLNTYLKITDFEDTSKNGLQVDTDKKEIKKIGYAVDATAYIFDKAIKEKLDLLIVHHGLFWGLEQTMTGLMYKRVSKLIKNDIALYACHLPLDAHPVVGNNTGLIDSFIKYFKIKKFKTEKFGEYHGNIISKGVRFSQKVAVTDIKKFCKSMGIKDTFYNFGNKKYIQSVAGMSGGGFNSVGEANSKNYDLFLTGEGAHHEHSQAKELGQSVVVGGHYETEIFGVQTLAQYLEKKFKLKTVFLDEKY